MFFCLFFWGELSNSQIKSQRQCIYLCLLRPVSAGFKHFLETAHLELLREDWQKLNNWSSWDTALWTPECLFRHEQTSLHTENNLGMSQGYGKGVLFRSEGCFFNPKFIGFSDQHCVLAKKRLTPCLLLLCVVYTLSWWTNRQSD